MKKIVMALALLACAAFVTPCYGENGKRVVEGDSKAMDTLSYCVGAAHAATMKADAALAPFALNIAELNKGLEDYLTGKAKLSYEEIAAKLEKFFTQTVAERRVEFEKPQVEVAAAPAEGEVKPAEAETKEVVFKVFKSDSERDEVSYMLGIFLGEEIRKPLYQGRETIHCYWLCKGFEDVYADATALNMHQMMEFMVAYKAKIEAQTTK